MIAWLLFGYDPLQSKSEFEETATTSGTVVSEQESAETVTCKLVK